MNLKKTALISVYNKEGIVDFAQSLIKFGYSILSSGGTAKVLKEADVEVTDVADITGLPAILDHRVVTLHPVIHGALLAEYSEAHNEERALYGIPWIDLVCVDFYPLEKAISDGLPKSEVINMIDIGGPTLALSAAKGDRIVICDSEDRELFIRCLEQEGRCLDGIKDYLIWKAFAADTIYRKTAADYLKRFLEPEYRYCHHDFEVCKK